MPRTTDVFLEFQRIGLFVKVTAIDPASLVEVSIVGPPSAGEGALGRTAMKKLAHVLGKKACPAADSAY
ncbi:MAG: DUF6898 family protein [Alphaproteobacteria bacterium]